jgi:uncharacterized protein Yka (UPF0111/DUF47 family)
MSDKYEEAVKWLRGRKNTAYTEKEREIIEYIEEIIWQYNDMRNS